MPQFVKLLPKTGPKIIWKPMGLESSRPTILYKRSNLFNLMGSWAITNTCTPRLGQRQQARTLSLSLKEAYLHNLKAITWGSVFLFNSNLAADCNSLQRLGRLAGHLRALCLTHAWLLFSRKGKKKKKNTTQHLTHTSDALTFVSITKRKYSLIA